MKMSFMDLLAADSRDASLLTETNFGLPRNLTGLQKVARCPLRMVILMCA
jgi:hypothetical protein